MRKRYISEGRIYAEYIFGAPGFSACEKEILAFADHADPGIAGWVGRVGEGLGSHADYLHHLLKSE
jgi:hypothetical protein